MKKRKLTSVITKYFLNISKNDNSFYKIGEISNSEMKTIDFLNKKELHILKEKYNVSFRYGINCLILMDKDFEYLICFKNKKLKIEIKENTKD